MENDKDIFILSTEEDTYECKGFLALNSAATGVTYFNVNYIVYIRVNEEFHVELNIADGNKISYIEIEESLENVLEAINNCR